METRIPEPLGPCERGWLFQDGIGGDDGRSFFASRC
jgi:hypothetical protein